MNQFRKILMTTLLAAIVLVVGNKKVEAQPEGCPDGSNKITHTFIINGCEVETEICYDCPPTAAPNWFSIGMVEIEDGCSLTLEEAKAEIRDELTSRSWLNTFCGAEIPPCGDTYEFSIREYMCWLKYLPGNNEPLEYYACATDAYCERTYEVCINSNNELEKTITNDWHQVGTPQCNVTEPLDPVNPGFTECWLLHDSCPELD